MSLRSQTEWTVFSLQWSFGYRKDAVAVNWPWVSLHSIKLTSRKLWSALTSVIWNDMLLPAAGVSVCQINIRKPDLPADVLGPEASFFGRWKHSLCPLFFRTSYSFLPNVFICLLFSCIRTSSSINFFSDVKSSLINWVVHLMSAQIWRKMYMGDHFLTLSPAAF